VKLTPPLPTECHGAEVFKTEIKMIPEGDDLKGRWDETDQSDRMEEAGIR
jgi:hypothetical protein